ncbi:hypothetical protein DYI37_01810 [Fulvimarina endophytica]|uniref:Uncharacterized protein n=1 Tax=Fulvimarina endophytica TaxID=2293836 RepID=A0A371XAL0_9HYPH|nr:curli-like amyloid fiber formation chaperone CsgH [Fulvimarina endophytica]RFC66222.1 hypothetical protein DYI37_01810 [Fulvimarina endophytica]
MRAAFCLSLLIMAMAPAGTASFAQSSSPVPATDGATPMPSAIGAIDVSGEDGTLRIAGRIIGLSAGEYEGRITIEKSGPSGRINTAQGGTAKLAAGETAVVATTSVNASAGDSLSVRFVVQAGGHEIASAQVLTQR